MRLTNVIAVVGTAVFLAACSQQEEPVMMVSPQPTFDKSGAGTCPVGYDLSGDRCVESNTRALDLDGESSMARQRAVADPDSM
jgi:hypothetical protein